MERAEAGVRTLIIYFNVTRPVNSKTYQKNGKFDIETYKKHMKFLSNWRVLDSASKKRLAGVYDNVTICYNYTQGIPKELLKKVCGKYTDDDGKQVKVSVNEVLERLVAKGFIRPLSEQPKRGSKFNLENGKYERKCWWNGKYLMKNVEYQYKLMMDKRYWDIENFPVSKDNPISYSGYAIAKNVIFKWIKNGKKEREEKSVKVEVVKEVEAEKQPTYTEEQKQELKAYAKELMKNMMDGIFDLATAQKMLAEKGVDQRNIDIFAQWYYKNMKARKERASTTLDELHKEIYG